MKSAYPWILATAFLILIIDLGVMGIKIFDNDSDIMAEAWIAASCWLVVLTCLLIRAWRKAKCPHCGKILLDRGSYCSYCGKELE